MKFLIVGLGNPGLLYENTRHNIGFKILKNLARKYNLEFKKEKKFLSYVASGNILGKDVHLLMPLTYMNLSGDAVRIVKDYYNIELNKLLIVLDDADIPFEEFRLKDSGSSGGHNGLKSIEENLKTQNFPRLRIGIGREKELKKFVLGRFSKEEKEKLPQIIEKAIYFIELWLEKGVQIAANAANVRIKKLQNNEDKNEQ